jgi:photosystem II stability/assembly factor-like uncharacterized protein
MKVSFHDEYGLVRRRRKGPPLACLLGVILIVACGQLPSQRTQIEELLNPPIAEDPEGRADWFLDQRLYPQNTLPAEARREAWDSISLQGIATASVAPAAAAWKTIGPGPTHSAYPSNWGTTSGRINAVAVSPSNAQIVLAGSSTGGLWRSTNAGTSFAPVSDDQVDLAVGSIAFAKSDTSVVYAGMGDIKLGYLGSGVLKSTDAGRTWARINNKSLPSPGTVAKIEVDAANPDRVYVAQFSRLSGSTVTSSGLYVSSDGGVNWTRTFEGSARDVVISPSDRRTIYLGATQKESIDPPPGLYRSTDSGITWSNVFTVPQPDPVFRSDVKIAIPTSRPDTIYVYSGGVFRGNTEVRLARSTDGGISWANRNTADLDIAQFGYNTYIAVDPTQPDTIYIGSRDVFKSTDGAATWRNLNRNFIQSAQFIEYAPTLSNTHPDQHALCFAPNNSQVLYIGNDGGLSKSTDGGATFQSLNSSLSLTQFVGITIHPLDTSLSFGGTQDNGTQRRLSNSNVWAEFVAGDGGRTVVNPLGPGTVFTTFIKGAVFRFYDYGLSFDRQVAFSSTFGEPDIGSRIAFYPPFVGNGIDSTLYFGTWRLFISTDTGENWFAPGGDTDLTKGINQQGRDVLSAISIAPSNLDVIYTGSSQGRAMVSTDGGKNWSDITSGLPDRFITCIAISPVNHSTAFLSVSGFEAGHVFKTTDRGLTWSDVSRTLPDIPAGAIVVDPNDSERIYVGTDIGVFRSVNGGASWQAFNNGMPPVIITAFSAHRSGLIQAATYGRGAYEIDTVSGRPAISSVEFDGKKKMTIKGNNLGPSPQVLINGADQGARVASASASAIKLKGKSSQLGLKTGDNSVRVITSDGGSNVFTLRL